MKKICVVGLGYVGLPLACAFAKNNYEVVGFDKNIDRVDSLNELSDWTEEVSNDELKSVSKNISFSNNPCCMDDSEIIIVAVPTPLKEDNIPDLDPLIEASEMIGKNLKTNAIVVFESTVFPGATEEICVPVIEKFSGLLLNKGFYVGYSPERINPGDKKNKLENIVKVVSASDPETLKILQEIYEDIIDAGVYLAPSIKVAEASKITENIQRDVNIALINELHQIFSIMNIESLDVIDAASTKWNFMRVEPGLVGGHCIGVDPHYMIYRSSGLGHIPNLMRNAREINEGMSTWVVNDFLQYCQRKSVNLLKEEVTILGFTFKKNCPDTRNTKVLNVYNSLKKMGIKVKIWDPCLDSTERQKLEKKGIQVKKNPPKEIGIGFLCVKHDEVMNFIKLNGTKIYDFTKVN